MMQAASLHRRTDRPRVVTLVDLLSRHGGAESLALSIATHLDPERFESILCVSRWPHPPALKSLESDAREALEELEETGVRFLPLERKYKIDPVAWMRLERFLRKERVDVLHAHKFGSNVWGAMVGKLARTPVMIAHEHTWSFEGQPARRFLDRELVSRACDRFIAVSREDQRRMIEIERIEPARTLFIPNGVAPLAPASGRDVRAELGIEPGVPLIGIVGLLRAQKAHHVLLHAAAKLAGDWPDMQVLIVGDGPERDTIDSLIGELGLKGTVRILGLRADVPDVLGALDIAVCCSDFEGSPLSVLEYMDAALPVVATSVGGIPDLIDSGVHGLLVPAGDSEALAGALAELLGDPGRARQMGVRGQERRRGEFTLDVMVRRFEELYCQLLEQRELAPQSA
jgi:glycosyltransferase involved in cell wall biosynthesis